MTIRRRLANLVRVMSFLCRSCIARRRAYLLAACAGVLLMQIGLCDAPWLGTFTEYVLKNGKPASLPPHLSLVLGLADGEKSLAVRQAALQVGAEVRTFNVASVQKRYPVVLVKHDEATQLTRAILLRPGGQLGKAVSYKTGAIPQPLPDAEARAALREELEFWSRQAGQK